MYKVIYSKYTVYDYRNSCSNAIFVVDCTNSGRTVQMPHTYSPVYITPDSIVQVTMTNEHSDRLVLM